MTIPLEMGGGDETSLLRKNGGRLRLFFGKKCKSEIGADTFLLSKFGGRAFGPVNW